jgi:hypothetical protein
MKTFKNRLYGVLLTIVNAGNNTSELRIIRKYPELSWLRVWANLHAAGLRGTIKSTWYAAIHDIIPTNERLAAIHLAATMNFSRCGSPGTIQYRITECAESSVMWNWTRARIAAILRVHPKYTLVEWTLRPTFQYWPAQKQVVIAWILAHLEAYRLRTQRRLSLTEYLDFPK